MCVHFYMFIEAIVLVFVHMLQVCADMLTCGHLL